MNHLEEREVVKFILNGRSFDTATSSQVAISRGVDGPRGLHFVAGPEKSRQWLGYEDEEGAEQVRFEAILFRTAKGTFFVHDHRTIKFPKGKPVVLDDARELTPEEAVEWIVSTGAAVLDGTGLPLPDEA